MVKRDNLLILTAEANKELAKATEYAVTVGKKGLSGEEDLLEDHLVTAQEQIDQALEEIRNRE